MFTPDPPSALPTCIPGNGKRKTGIVNPRFAVVSLTVCLTGESAVSTAFPFAGCFSSLRVPIFVRLGRLRGSTLAFCFVWFLPGALYRIACASSSNRVGAEYIDEAVPGMKAHSLVLWNSFTSVEQKR
uniref:Orf127a n=1 Tax=Batis maritima TaxID=4436 RepID=A0A068BHI4_BATMA|nr:orf127a [Batis maritima]AIC83318.1 orf127a [Batis maritima]